MEVLLTLALTTGGYALAMALHMSAPLAVVAAVTYAVVVFSILGQELTIPALLRKAVAAQES
jgi:NhaP-type Na+/H+ or K+/H+ antiporter